MEWCWAFSYYGIVHDIMIGVEICIASDGAQSVEEAVTAAFVGGASTVELCSTMHSDGLTPTKEQIEQARNATQVSPKT